MFQIFVPVDFSEYSTAAFNYACLLAKRIGGRLDLVHVRSERGGGQPEPHVQVCDPAVAMEYVVLHGPDVAKELLTYLDHTHYDLVIMGTHGRTGLSHLFLGSIAEKMMRHSPVPVVTLHKDSTCREICRILVPVDFSEQSTRALQYAAGFAAKINAEMEILHVMERAIVPGVYPEGVFPVIPDEPEFHRKIAGRLRKFCEPFSQRIVQTHLAAGLPSEEIVKTAEERDVDLIVMATRSLSGLQHLLVGSTAQRVARLARRPVLTVQDLSAQNPDSTHQTANKAVLS